MKRVALCVGVNDYPGTQNDLSGCVNDANDWATCLNELQFNEVSTLLDSSATKKNILEGIKSRLDACSKGDLFFLTNSSHGSYVPDVDGDELDKRDECLCPYDIDKGNYIVDDEIHDLLMPAKVRGVQVVVFSDSCHSGTVLKLFEIPSQATQYLAVRFLPPGTFLPTALTRPELRLLSMAKSTKVISKATVGILYAGCQDNEYSYDAEFDGKPNGAFTYFGIKSLKELMARGIQGFTYRDWYNKIRTYLPNQTYPQRPNFDATRAMASKIVFGGVHHQPEKENTMAVQEVVKAPLVRSYTDFLTWLKSLGGNLPAFLILVQKLQLDIEKATPEVQAVIQDLKDIVALVNAGTLAQLKGLKPVARSTGDLALEEELRKLCESHFPKGEKGIIDILRNAWSFLKDNPELLTLLLSLIKK